MNWDEFQRITRLHVRQRITPMINRYEVRAAAPDGSEGELIAFVEQKRIALKEQVTLYTDQSRQHVLAGFKARRVLDVGATYDVTDHAGAPIGLFRKNFAASLLRSTWHIELPGLPPGTGQERNQAVAVLRRIWDFLPVLGDLPFAWPYHFDFTLAEQPAYSVDRRFGLRDRYQVEIHDPRLDRRFVIAQAVALDALQRR